MFYDTVGHLVSASEENCISYVFYFKANQGCTNIYILTITTSISYKRKTQDKIICVPIHFAIMFILL